ncbi:hypothetical protein EVAR_30538_1 [Eumeta japonica]|uniref:Uncharacterized protein n=1 Tax=Eumeta variegata TaxID=151549 RepID=A0A4C1VPL5_EUMVA|nr:hypothetical protein EVAR_30538_1 [Eumeta japonica]
MKFLGNVRHPRRRGRRGESQRGLIATERKKEERERELFTARQIPFLFPRVKISLLTLRVFYAARASVYFYGSRRKREIIICVAGHSSLLSVARSEAGTRSEGFRSATFRSVHFLAPSAEDVCPNWATTRRNIRVMSVREK